MNLVVHMMAMRLGIRVRTPDGIFYAHTGLEVSAGTLGTVRAVSHAGALIDVEWDGIEGLHTTAFNSIEALPACVRCSECRGENHHWLEHCDDPAEVEKPFVGYVCKHCEERIAMCDACDGPNEKGHECLDALEDVEERDPVNGQLVSARRVGEGGGRNA